MKITAEPRSDQWNADDFSGGPRTFTIAGVKAGAAEQKYDIQLVEGEGRVWRPPLTMLRVLLNLWGDEASAWEGRKVTLFQDPTVRFGKEVPGGIRISHMSDIGGKQAKVPVTIARGKRALYTVEPLTERKAAPAQPARDFCAEADALAGDVDALRNLYREAAGAGADPEALEYIKGRAVS